MISNVSIQLPSQLNSRNEVGTGERLLFGSVITTEYGTTLLGSIHYSWNFGDSGGTNSPAVSHTFNQPGTYHVSLIILLADDSSLQASTPTFTVVGEFIQYPHHNTLTFGSQIL